MRSGKPAELLLLPLPLLLALALGVHGCGVPAGILAAFDGVLGAPEATHTLPPAHKTLLSTQQLGQCERAAWCCCGCCGCCELATVFLFDSRKLVLLLLKLIVFVVVCGTDIVLLVVAIAVVAGVGVGGAYAPVNRAQCF